MEEEVIVVLVVQGGNCNLKYGKNILVVRGMVRMLYFMVNV